jgi:uncharacterized protein YigE (DUF2233 family)
MSRAISVALLQVSLACLACPAMAECRADTFEGAPYSVCEADPADVDVRIFWQDDKGAPYPVFNALDDDLEDQGLDLAFAMNGGMFGEDFSPIGLYIENGRELRPANTTDAHPDARPVPNFYKKPNGVFYVGEAGAGVMETARFLAERPPADFATQSGPLLVIEGAIHPAFIVGSSDRKRRNGVGVCKGGVVRFAISDSAVNFHDFARFFRDHLGCPNALFLDGGSAPGLYAPELNRNDWPGHGSYGPIVGAVRPAD